MLRLGRPLACPTCPLPVNLNFAGRMLEVDMSTLPYAQTGGRADLAFTFVPAHGAIALVLAAGRVLNPGRSRN